MTNWKGLCWSALLSIAAGCGSPTVDDDAGAICQDIVGGHLDDRLDAVLSLDDARGEQLCTGTLIGSKDARSAILTAAHCVEWPLSVAVFGEDRSRPTAVIGIAETVPHPDFDFASGGNDVAVILLDELVTAAVPMSVANEQDGLAVGEDVAIYGYGYTEDLGEAPFRSTVTTTIVSVDAASFEYDQARGGPCLGDSGGPAVSFAAGVPVVVGVTSHGSGGCWSDGVSTRTSSALAFLAPFTESTRSICTKGRP